MTPQEAAREILYRKSAQDSLTAFSLQIDIPGKPATEDDDETRYLPVETQVAAHHRLLMDTLQRVSETPGGRAMVFMPPGSAKALVLDTPIPTPSGWTQMGDLRVGDRVFDETGSPCSVTWVSPIHRNRPVYSVRTDCGDVITADRDHEWLVRLCGKRPIFKLRETHELSKKRTKRPMLNRAGPLITAQAELPIDPYLLGVWLGDGASRDLRISSSEEDQPWLRKELHRLGYTTSNSSVKQLFGMLGVRHLFAGLGLLGNKHIPPVYMRSSKEQRLALVQGLIDTDGTVCKRRGSATFCNTNRQLAESFRELVRSLGVKAGWSEGRAVLNGKDCGPSFRVSFYHKHAARMPRKAALCRDQYRTPNTYLDVKPAGTADTVCIEVDSPSHLFLCGKSMTPTHNSTYASVVFPAWFMGRKPGAQIILASYATNLAKKHGRRTRQIVASSKYQNIFNTTLKSDQSAANEWALLNGSEYMAGGLQAGLTGNRADGLLIDDPVAGREEAESDVLREKTFAAYSDDARSRIKPSGWRVIVQTRWHESDLAGSILPDSWAGESGKILCKDGHEWDVICLPAEADRADDPLGRKMGEGLWPEWFKPGHWDEFKFPPRSWLSLYQQKPSAEQGTYFQRQWMQPYKARPESLMVYLSGDFAVTDGDGDFTEIACWGVDHADNVYMLDWWHGQASADVWITAILDMVDRYKPQWFIGETGPIRRAVEPFLNKTMAERRSYVACEWLVAGGDKASMARTFQALCSVGKVYWPAVDGSFTPKAERVIDQLMRFPNGRYDDAVDACSLFGRFIDKTWAATPKRVKPEVVWDQAIRIEDLVTEMPE